MIHHVYANRSNIGDWLSAKGIQSMLGVQVKEHLIDEGFVEITLAELKKARGGDAIIIGGGGLFMDYFTPFWSGVRELSEHLPLCIWGVGCCDHKSRPSRPPGELIRAVAQRAHVCAVRDELTKQFLGDEVKTIVAACPSVTMIHPPAAPGEALLHAVHYGLIGEDAGYEHWSQAVRSLAEKRQLEYVETNNEIEPDDDGALANELKLYARSKYIISSRLHGCIIGLAMNKRVLAISGDWKVESFMQAAGLGRWICDAADPASLEKHLETLDAQPSVENFIDEARCRNREIAVKVTSAIGNRS